MAETETKVITVQKGSTKTALKLAVELSLSGLRKLLISKNLMAEEDLFTDANGAEIRKSDEADFLIKDALGTGTSLTLKSTRLSKTITVQKGLSKNSVKVDDTLPLAELRKLLITKNLMAEEDLFTDANGAEIKNSDEAEFLTKDALGGSLTITLKRAAKTITVQKGTVKTPYQVTLDQKLSELRVVLMQANLMSANDLFQTATDVISTKNENNVIVQDSLKNDTLTIVSNVWE
jgi:hypothetical protein